MEARSLPPYPRDDKLGIPQVRSSCPRRFDLFCFTYFEASHPKSKSIRICSSFAGRVLAKEFIGVKLRCKYCDFMGIKYAKF